MVGLPSFVTHNKLDQSFSVETSNPEDITISDIWIIAALIVPIRKYDKVILTDQKSILDLKIEVFDACKTTKL